ncbi:MAG: HAD hydrolase-like protein [Bacteroidales bacterium]|nr:HAD hydrolase-like protein [Bacteroidales bacterium]
MNKLEHLKPIPAGVEPFYHRDNNIRALIFDIYGTLLISASGDVDEADVNEENLRAALKASHYHLNNGAVGNNGCDACSKMLHAMKEAIGKSHAENRANGNHHPEVDILEIWREVMKQATAKGWVRPEQDADLRTFTFVFELLSNRVYPMPGMNDLIKSLHRSGKPMGIVSNAQFYTPVIMNFLIDGEVQERETIEYFDPELTVYSYLEKRAKPDTRLFEKLTPVLKEKYGIAPHEALFVGNDMMKDVYAAQQVGFKTALFAGDKRSLRLRKDHKHIQRVKPDHIITKLAQLKEVTGIWTSRI